MTEAPELGKKRFCQDCGKSLVQLDVPHTSRPCEVCNKTTYFVSPGDDGVGIKIEKGDTFTIPAGWLTISLDPAKSRGTFTRHGVNWFVRGLIFGALPSAPEKVVDYLRYLDGEADKALLASPRMADLDINSQSDMNRAYERFKDEQDSIEHVAILLSAGAHRSLDLLGDDSSREELVQWVTVTVAAQMMLLYKQALENHVWAGYEQTRLVYGIAVAGASSPKEAKAIEALRPIFANLSEYVLAGWVGADANVKEKLGIEGIDDAVVNALARYHLKQFELGRQKADIDAQAVSRKWGNRFAGAGAAAAVAAVIVSVLVALGILHTSSPTSPSSPTPSASQSVHSPPSSTGKHQP